VKDPIKIVLLHTLQYTSTIYIIKQDIRIYIYMLRIAGQTARPIGLKYFLNPFFHGQLRTLQLIMHK